MVYLSGKTWEDTVMKPDKLIELCTKKTVWIQTHNFPDPDAISSAFGLQKLLENFGIASRICHEGQIDKLSSVKMLSLCGIEMHSYDEIESQMNADDMIVLVDCQKSNGNTTDFVGDELAAIDHHPTVVKIDYEYSDLRITGACASIIAEYYKTLNVNPDVKVATALMYGLRMDTLQLSRGVTEFDLDMLSFLFHYSDKELLNELETNNMEFTDLRAYGEAIENARVFGKVCLSFLDFFCPDALVAALSDFFLALAEAEVVIIFAKRDTGYKFSFRSERSDVNAGVLAGEILEGWGNGGGHATMAGGFVEERNIPGDRMYLFDTVQEKTINLIEAKYPQIL